ncbi:MAG TPA: aminoglycoside phosphotransferase family protein [Chthonomonadaceae bacterium]|nr:aminoglycoside phosphotransferase family protein [Chthonomonadaceae bacterium]
MARRLEIIKSGSSVLPQRLLETCAASPEFAGWLSRLPNAVDELRDRWNLALGQAIDHSGCCSWVAPARRADGTRAILKLGLSHFEGRDEIGGLRFWDGDPFARLLEADEALNAMLLERCEPGSPLRDAPEAEQDTVIAGLFRRLWRLPAEPQGFRDLAEMAAYWSGETLADASAWTDVGMVHEGLRLLEELPRTAERTVLLATDLHAGNVLRAERETWLAIDPKPFLGDPAYDATQHLLNCRDRLRSDPAETILRFADLLEVDAARVRLWLFARCAAEPRDEWNDDYTALARILA